MTRIVHTADWHLGARLVERERHEEQAAFLDWLLTQLIELRPELLIVAGDIFDSATPPQEALTLYYRFLGRLAATVKCRTLILGGNHDSPATLHAPRDILRAIEVRVIARPPADPAEGLLEFDDVVVCAVPYLRERDVRISSPGESADQVAAAILPTSSSGAPRATMSACSSLPCLTPRSRSPALPSASGRVATISPKT